SQAPPFHPAPVAHGRNDLAGVKVYDPAKQLIFSILILTARIRNVRKNSHELVHAVRMRMRIAPGAQTRPFEGKAALRAAIQKLRRGLRWRSVAQAPLWLRMRMSMENPIPSRPVRSGAEC